MLLLNVVSAEWRAQHQLAININVNPLLTTYNAVFVTFIGLRCLLRLVMNESVRQKLNVQVSVNKTVKVQSRDWITAIPLLV